MPILIIKIISNYTFKVGNLEYLPAIVDHDSTFYIRKDGDHLFFGGFEPRASDVVIREDWHEAFPKSFFFDFFSVFKLLI